MDDARLIDMANQIASFFAPYSEDEAIDGISTHLKNFWEPRMREGLIQAAATNPDVFHPHVLAALPRLS